MMEENYLLVDLDKILNNIKSIKEKSQNSKFLNPILVCPVSSPI